MPTQVFFRVFGKSFVRSFLETAIACSNFMTLVLAHNDSFKEFQQICEMWLLSAKANGLFFPSISSVTVIVRVYLGTAYCLLNFPPVFSSIENSFLICGFGGFILELFFFNCLYGFRPLFLLCWNNFNR